MKRIITALLLVASTMGLSAQEGTWSGELDIQGMKLPLVFNFDADGCTLDSPSQGVKGIKAEKSYTPEGKFKVVVPMIGAAYEGVMVMNVISGTYMQNGISLPLTLKPGAPKANRPQTPVGPFSYKTEEVTFRNGDYTFHGTLSLPENYGEQTPVVLLVTGSGQQDRDETLLDHKPFAVIADALARQGIVSLRYDDRGFNDPSVAFFNFTTHNFKQDAAAGVDFLRSRFKKVGVIGHSEGGTIALMLAAEGKADFVVSLAGMAVSGKETLLWQNRVSLESMGIPQSDFEQYMEVVTRVFDKAVEGRLNTADIAFVPESLRPVVQQAMQQLSSPYMQHILTVDVRSLLSSIKCPVLALNGKKDQQVQCQANLEAIDQGLVNSKHQVVALENLNHLFQHCQTGSIIEYQQIEETFAPEALQQIITWLKALLT